MKYSSVILIISLFFSGCYREKILPGDIPLDTPDWTDITHGIRNQPDYEKVFPIDAVQRLDIVIQPEDWAFFWSDMTTMFGEFNSGAQFSEDHKLPDYFPCDIFFEGKQWYHVGIRPKGNAPLGFGWVSGQMKFPFKLDFDEYEDIYPDIRNQRFYGFRQLSLKNAWGDNTLIREYLIDGLFREAGLPVARAALYEVYLHYGEGEKFSGLYTLVEDVDDTVLPNYFDDVTGVLYKPEGGGAMFNMTEFTTEGFEVHSDADSGNYSDIQKLFQTIHDPIRTENPVAWRDQLIQVLDTRFFLKALAANRVVENWDVYGALAHNYYLYHNPVNDLLVWIPWDHDNSLKGGEEFGNFDFDWPEVGEEWPLIRYLIDDPAFKQQYKEEMGQFVHGPFQPDRFITRLEDLLQIAAVYALREQIPFTCLPDPMAFDHERELIIQIARQRYQDALEYLGR